MTYTFPAGLALLVTAVAGTGIAFNLGNTIGQSQAYSECRTEQFAFETERARFLTGCTTTIDAFNEENDMGLETYNTCARIFNANGSYSLCKGVLQEDFLEQGLYLDRSNNANIALLCSEILEGEN